VIDRDWLPVAPGSVVPAWPSRGVSGSADLHPQPGGIGAAPCVVHHEIQRVQPAAKPLLIEKLVALSKPPIVATGCDGPSGIHDQRRRAGIIGIGAVGKGVMRVGAAVGGDNAGRDHSRAENRDGLRLRE